MLLNAKNVNKDNVNENNNNNNNKYNNIKIIHNKNEYAQAKNNSNVN